MTARFVLVPASYVYLLRDGDHGTEVLLQLRRGTSYMDGHWAAAAAGHVEQGETAYDAAHREAVEELGITDIDLRFAFTMHRTQHADAIDERVDWFFTARSWSGEPGIVEPEKCAELQWCRLDRLPEPMVPHEAYALAHLGTGVGYLAYGWDHAPTRPLGGVPGATSATRSRRSPHGREAMSNEELSPMPTPFTQEPDLVPGGVDALPEDPADNGLSRDLDPDDNPAVDDVLPGEVAEPDDKPQAPEGKADDAEAGTTSQDRDAGQEAEDGSVEPPA